MNKKELIEQLDKIVFLYQNLDSAFDAAHQIGFLEIEGSFSNAVWAAFEGMLSIIEKQLDTDWISWYIFDNQCGEKDLRATNGPVKSLKEIKTTKDLAQLILEDKD